MNNEILQHRRRAAVPRGIATAYQTFVSRAENAEIWDVEGNRLIDFAGGIAVLNTGHRHPRIMEAVRQQLDSYTHTAFQILPYAPYVEVCERLVQLAPIKNAKAVLFSTGAEAVENAVKIARAATGRPGVIAFSGGFHGRTAMTTALTGKVSPYKTGFGISPPGIYHVPFPVPQHGTSTEDSLKALDTLFRTDIGPDNTAAIIIEPVQGEGGFHPAPVDLLTKLRGICSRAGIVLIADEIQTGFARTGKMFGVEHSGISPDIMTVAKSMAGGFPLSGVIGRADIMEEAEPGGLGGTYAGNPVSCAAALAVMDVIAEEKLVERANTVGTRIKTRLQEIAKRNDSVPIAALRGPGAMVAFDIVRKEDGQEPDAVAAKRVTQAALDAGLVLLSCGVFGNTIRILNPLTITDDILDEGLDILEGALKTALETED
ncbi:4-aminobutyrate aminotransferase/(S)-3-amino-2-methylpropionate transaminase [Labrenzia sp. EL_13]|nr:4-aminobutyrate aminotransferase/(S)-3-amino-2-methylpropionate transaminase [Labrenzia sp. EL_13]